MVFIFNFFFPVYKVSTRRSASISTYSILSFSILDQDGTLERSFFDFFNSYLMPWKKSPKDYKKPQISNTLFITIETNKNKNNDFIYFVVIYNINSTYRP